LRLQGWLREMLGPKTGMINMGIKLYKYVPSEIKKLDNSIALEKK
jgi:hypothetical protein